MLFDQILIVQSVFIILNFFKMTLFTIDLIYHLVLRPINKYNYLIATSSVS